MPTGYTSIIEDGEPTFEEYAWRCARAFGAFIMERDNGLDAKIALRREPDRYHIDANSRAKDQLIAFDRLSDAEYEAQESTRVHIANEAASEAAERARFILARYAAMRAKAETWTPPTPEHARLREFMIEQIDTSTKYMSVGPWTQEPVPRAEARQRILDNIRYHAEHYAEEVKRTEERNAWAAALVDSLGTPPQNDK